ncbi:unnamed protein product [Brachyspira suanatina]|uniref:Fe-S hydro-lyase tartrate dehydratase alpha-type catalytic domain-containing protein n=1 Tax=Brachyspira suanatina TaxID=381802 RepID=A0A0G4K9B9_9SPIR|nr:fumarate hydratase [Brachyspira suanatina]CRF34762.1 unnamed protein product [Brachyspira suanatina]
MDVHFTGVNLTDAINKGVALGYTKSYLRKSVLNDPIDRKNTTNNTPAIIHYNILDTDKLRITTDLKVSAVKIMFIKYFSINNFFTG